MRRYLLLAILVLAILNLIFFALLVGIRPVVNDEPFVIAKTATENNWETSIGQMSIGYHKAQTREKFLMLGGFASATISVLLIVLSVSAYAIKIEKAEQAGAVNPHACGTFGTSAAEQPLVPKASGDT